MILVGSCDKLVPSYYTLSPREVVFLGPQDDYLRQLHCSNCVPSSNIAEQQIDLISTIVSLKEK